MAVVNGFKFHCITDIIGADTVKIALLTSTHSTDIDADIFFDDVNTNEVSGTNYTTGGEALLSVTITQDNTNNRGVLDADDHTFTNLTVSAVEYVCIYVDRGTAATSPIISIEQLASVVARTAQDLVLNADAIGLATIS